jgi:predicted PurR-regulated permease PerM
MLLLLFVFGLLFLFVPLLQAQLISMLVKLPALVDELEHYIMPQEFSLSLLKSTLNEHIGQASQIAKWMWQALFHSGVAIIEWFMHLLIVGVVFFYLLRDWPKIIRGLHSLLPQRYAPAIMDILQQCDGVLSTFLRGQLVVMLVLGVFYSLALWILGVNYSLVLGMVVGILSIVPYLGSITGLLAAILVVYFQFEGLWHLVMVLLIFGVGHILEGMVLTPWLIGKKLGLHPVAVIFALLAGGQLGGLMGVILALPVAAILVALTRQWFLTAPKALQGQSGDG